MCRRVGGISQFTEADRYLIAPCRRKIDGFSKEQGLLIFRGILLSEEVVYHKIERWLVVLFMAIRSNMIKTRSGEIKYENYVYRKLWGRLTIALKNV